MNDFIKELEKYTSLTYDIEDEDANGELYVVERKLKTISMLMKDIKRLKQEADKYNKALSEAIEAVNAKTPIQRIEGNVTNSNLTGILLLCGSHQMLNNNYILGTTALANIDIGRLKGNK